MNPYLKAITIFVIIVHLMFFVLEAIFWMRPEVHNLLIELLDNPVRSDYTLQALTLKNLFVNQGFYNLFLVITGIAGFVLAKKGKTEIGSVLILVMCLTGAGAGLILALSTKAYLLAFLQGVPAAFVSIKVIQSFYLDK